MVGSAINQKGHNLSKFVENPVHIRDLNATILHCLGMDHNRFTFRFEDLNQKPTGVEPATDVKRILA